MSVKHMPLSLEEIELATGLSREVLRKWEIRYGFPNTSRGARGERLFLQKEVAKLHIMRRLIEFGWRPGHLAALGLTELRRMLVSAEAGANSALADVFRSVETQALLKCFAPKADFFSAQEFMRQLIEEQGLPTFIDVHLPAFNLAIGDAWSAGALSIPAEHYFTDVVHSSVNAALEPYLSECDGPRIVIATPPGEGHTLGLLALKAALTLGGFKCINLGPQVPVDELASAVKDFDAQIVGISLSSNIARQVAISYCQALRRLIPRDCRLWIGGGGAKNLPLDKANNIEIYSATKDAVATLNPMKNRNGCRSSR